MKKGLLILSLAAITASSCKKEDTKNCPKTMDGLAGTYTLVKVEQGGGGAFSNVTTFYTEACERDNKLTLNAAGTWDYADAGTQCDPSQSDTGSWSIGADGKLNIGPVGSLILDDVDVVSFDCSTLVGETDFGSAGGVPLKVRFTFNK